MSEEKASPAPFEQTAYQRAELDALGRMLTISEGTFSLSIAICNSPVLRDHLIAHITQETKGIEVVRISADTLDIFDYVQRQIADRHPSAVFVAEIEKALADENKDRVLQNLNVSRESWRSRYPCPVVFWLPEYVSALLATRARDLWSWVSHHFEFVSEQAAALAGRQDAYAGKLSLAGNLDVHEKQFRIAELEQRISDLDEEPKEQIRQHALTWLNELAYLYDYIGQLDRAEQTLQKLLRWTQPDDPANAATAYSNLGLIYHTRGDLEKAEAMLKKALEINEKLGRLEGTANQYSNLGSVYLTRGDMEKAEAMHRKSLEIEEKLGHIEGMAGDYGNLGVIRRQRGDLDGAEEMHRKTLEIEKKLGRLEGQARQYISLGNIYFARGDLDQAEAMQKKSLEIHEKLGHLEGMANNHANLGAIYHQRRDSATAREHWEKAIALYEQIGMRHMVTKIQGWIDRLDNDAVS
jgi:tetratricopeptide (TPR) repeat protein